MGEDLTEVPYIGDDRAEWLREAGYRTIDDVATADAQRLAREVTGISRYDIESHIIPNAREMAGVDGAEPNAGSELEKLPGVGRKILGILQDNGWTTLEDVAELDPEVLRDEVTFQTKWSYHFHIDKARDIIESARELSDDRHIQRRAQEIPSENTPRNVFVVAGRNSLESEPGSVSANRVRDAVESIGTVETLGILDAETGGNAVAQYTRRDGVDIETKYFPQEAYKDEYTRNDAVMEWADDVVIIGSGKPVGLYVWLANQQDHPDAEIHHFDE